jgi:hypothetical protein
MWQKSRFTLGFLGACAMIAAVLGAARPALAGPCQDAVQGRIAWDYNGNTTWNPANVDRLCGDARSDQPARCFDRVLHGGINWGGGTRWEWSNAIDLCRGTSDADATIFCFKNYIAQGKSWPDAIAQAAAACHAIER